MKIDVCICTFQRNSLADCLQSVARQDCRPLFDLRVIVADNNVEPVMRQIVADAGADFGLATTYVHAPARNISIARNACLDHASADWIVFIDDDEVANPDWLRRLMRHHVDADVIFGVSIADYRDAAPRWLKRADFHSNRLAGNDQPHNGYTCNVALRRSAIDHLRFSLPLGTSGGEDTMFFEEARLAGLRFGYEPDAIVHEEIPDNRSTMRWVLRRRFRSGQTHHLLLRGRGKHTAAIVPLAAAKSMFSIGAAAVSAINPAKSAYHLARGWFHMGVIAAALGSSSIQEYGQGGGG